MPDQSFWDTWLSQPLLYGNNTLGCLSALAIVLAIVMVCNLLQRILARRATILAQRSHSHWDDAVVKTMNCTRWWFIVLAAFSGTLILELPDKSREFIQTAVIMTLLLQTALWGHVLITAGVGRYVQKRMAEDPASVTLISVLAWVCKTVLFVMLALLALENLGIDVTALIAGLGVGGIAVALAVQDILGDLLASLSIAFDRPFVLGDFIVVGNEVGTVEKIGIKTTRLRSLSGEQLIFANNDLLQSRIRNYKRMYERRILFTIGITYQTASDQLQDVPRLLREAIESEDQVRFDRAHFKSFGDSSLQFEVVYFVLTPEYDRYMEIQQAVNLKIFEQFAFRGIEFAYPTQTLYVQQSGSAHA